MTEDSRTRRQARATRTAATPRSPQLAAVTLVRAKHARVVALARWNAHSRDCARCEDVPYAGDPAQCCPDGRKRLLRALATHTAVIDLRAAAGDHPGLQLALPLEG